MKNSIQPVIYYALFAAVAIAVNIGCQMLFYSIYSFTYVLEMSILIGTVSGLLTKYILDKKYIFQFNADSIIHDGKSFFLYTLMGGLTTVIFWGIECLFYLIFRTDFMRYVGGVTGLIIGYTMKYLLDKRFVFIDSNSVGER